MCDFMASSSGRILKAWDFKGLGLEILTNVRKCGLKLILGGLGENMARYGLIRRDYV